MSENKKISINEFKMWLEGVEEMQEEGWVPNPTQWKRIREKLNSVIENEQPSVDKQEQYVGVKTKVRNNQQQSTMAPIANVPSALVPPNLPPGPPPSALFGSPDGLQARTPSIDTTDGNYKSAFT